MTLDEHVNTLGKAIDQLVYELGISSPNQLWDEAGETANRASWYKRVAPDSKARTTEKHIAKLINGLERNGHKLSQEQMDSLYAAIGMKVVRQEELDRIRRLEILKDPDRQHLFDARLARFVSGTRHDEIANVLKLIEQLKTSGGYLIISGRAGEGKTTMVCQLINSHQFGREQTPYHIIPFTPDHDHQVTLLHSLMASLALKHPYLSDFWTPIFHRDTLAGIFARMLREISEKRKQEVIFIDGLDQIKPDANMQERDLDFLPLEVPKGIVIVVSTRPDDVLKPLQLRSPLLQYKLPRLKRTDMDRILARYEVHLGETIADQLYRATEQNALYVDLVAQELAHPDTNIVNPGEILRLVSSNPGNIFLLSIKRLKHHDKFWKEVIKPVLGLLLAAQEPLSTSAIGQILLLEDEALRDGLWRLGGLVEEDGSGKHYLYHLKLRDYLREDTSNHSKEYVISQKEERLLHKLLADWCTKGDLSRSTMIWEDTKDANEQERRIYARQYCITHLYEAQEWQQLFTILDEDFYGRASLRHDPSAHSYAQDLDIGRRAAVWEGWGIEEGIEYLPQLWRYTLLRSSLVSRADKYAAEAFEVLVLLGREQEAIGLEGLLTDPVKKVEALTRIAEELNKQENGHDKSRQLLIRASEVFRTIEMEVDLNEEKYDEKEEERWEVLRLLLKQLVRTQEWDRAASVVHSVKNPYQKAEALKQLAIVLTEVQEWERAEAVVRSIEDSEDRGIIIIGEEWVDALNVLADALGSYQEWNRLEAMVQNYEIDWERDLVLKALSVALTKHHKWKEAERAAQSIVDDEEKAEALIELSNQLEKAGEWNRAVVIAQSIEEKVKKVQALTSLLITHSKWERTESLWVEAEAEARLIEDPEKKVQALTTLLVALEQSTAMPYAMERIIDLWIEVEDYVSSIENQQKRLRGLHILAIAFAKIKFWDRALEIVSFIEEGLQRDLTLREVVSIMAEAQEWELASDITFFDIKTEWVKEQANEKVLSAEVFAFAQSQKWEEADDPLWYIDSSWEARREVMKPLLKQLVQAHEWERAKAIAEAAWGEEGFEEKAEALVMLVDLLTEAQAWERAETVALSIRESKWRGKALSILAKQLIRVQQVDQAKKIWVQAEAAIRSVDDWDGEIWYEEILSLIDPMLERLVMVRAREHAETIARDAGERALGTVAVAFAKIGEWERAEAIARSIEYDYKRDEIWQALVNSLTEARQWKWAETVALEMEKSNRGMAWQKNEAHDKVLVAQVVVLVQMDQWESAKAVAQSIKSSKQKAKALSIIAVGLAHKKEWEQAETAWIEIEAMAQLGYKSFEKEYILSELVIGLAKTEQWKRAEEVVDSIKDSMSVREALSELIAGLIKAGQCERAEGVVQSIKSLGAQEDARKVLIENLVRIGKCDRAEAVARAVKDDRARAEALKVLAISLAKEKMWDHAESVARSIGFPRKEWKKSEKAERYTESDSRGRALKAIVISLANAEEWKHAEEVAKAIKDEYVNVNHREEALEALVSSLSSKYEWKRAKAIAFSIQDIRLKASAMRKLVETLVEAGEKEDALRLIQLIWLQIDTSELAIKMLPLVYAFISLKPEISWEFYHSFVWIDDFLQR